MKEKLEGTLGYMLAKSHRKFYCQLRKELSYYNLTPPQFGVLVLLWDQDGLSQVEVGNALDVDRTTLTGIINRLEKSNLVERKADPEDRRSKLIYLTQLGREYEKQVISVAQKINQVFSAKFSPQELEQLLTLLQRITE